MPLPKNSGQSSDTRKHDYKVGRLIDEYSLAEMDSELVARWTGDGRDRSSLRDLAEFFNQQVLRTAMEEEGLDPLEGEIENTYRLLTDDDVSRGVEVTARRGLARDGIDVERLEADFVTHQAIHTYLTNYHDIEPPQRSDSDQIQKDLDTLNKLQNRTKSVTEYTIERLKNTDRVSIEEPRVFVNVNVTCQACGASYSASELLDAGHCDCQ